MKETILEAFNFRHACKGFDPAKKIPKEDFDFILETGRLSPSSFGFEPWKFLVIQNKQLREKLRKFTWGGEKQIPTASHLVVILARKASSMKYGSKYTQDFMKEVRKLPEDRIKDINNYYKDFQEKDFKLLESERAMFDWACKQTYIVLANMMTAAAMIKIDSCPIEGFDAEKVNKVLEKNFDINIKEFGLSCMVTFGYRLVPARKKTRQSIDQIVTWYN